MAHVLVVQADSVHIPMADQSVHMVCTSPPYFGLRQYDGIMPTIWRGEPGCAHVWGDMIAINATNHTDKRRWQHARNGRDEEQPPEKRVAWLRTMVPQGQHCQHCGAWAGCLGNEPLHDCHGAFTGANCGTCYVCHIRQVAAEIWRVLRDDGTFWLNVGDTYNSNPSWGRGHSTLQGRPQDQMPAKPTAGWMAHARTAGLPSKSLIGIPWRVALALQQDGWTLRSDIVWSKPNPMPESVTDRPTRAHEYVFLFSKQERYFYDADAIREPSAIETSTSGYHRQRRFSDQHQTARPAEANRIHYGPLQTEAGVLCHDNGRNARSVWTINPEPFSGAHFATFPQALVAKCILAGTSAYGCCPQCQSPYTRIVERQRLLDGHIPVTGTFAKPDEPFRIPPNGKGHYRYSTQVTDHGWRPTCGCVDDALANGCRNPDHMDWLTTPQPAIVLDPFAGSGTTGVTAWGLGRSAVLCDLSMPYLRTIAKERLGFAAWAEPVMTASMPPDAAWQQLALIS